MSLPPSSNRSRSATIISAVIFFAFLTLSSSDQLAIDSSCRVPLILDKARAVVQRTSFWRTQLRLGDDAVQSSQKFRVQRAEPDFTAEKMRREFAGRFYNNVGRASPMRGTLSKLPQELRTAADTIQMEKAMAMVDSVLSEKARPMLVCRAEIARRAGVQH